MICWSCSKRWQNSKTEEARGSRDGGSGGGFWPVSDPSRPIGGWNSLLFPPIRTKPSAARLLHSPPPASRVAPLRPIPLPTLPAADPFRYLHRPRDSLFPRDDRCLQPPPSRSSSPAACPIPPVAGPRTAPGDMDRIVVNRTGIDHQIHLKLRRSVVPILIYLVRQTKSGEQRDLRQPVGVLPGLVTVSASNFCHIIAAARLLFPRTPDLFRFEILFPNGTAIAMSDIAVQRGETLAAFFVPGSFGNVDEVHFVDQPVSRNQNIKMFGYAVTLSPPVQALSELCDGFVTHPDDPFFRHDCTPSHTSSGGSAVFDDQDRLIGISYERQGLTKALNVGGIRYELAQIYEGMNEMSISQIVEHIRVLGEERVGNLAGPS